MKKLLLTSLGVAALALCSTANAAITVTSSSPGTLIVGTTTSPSGLKTTIGFHDDSPVTDFTETIFFNNSLNGTYAGSITTTSLSDTTYSSAVLTGPGLPGGATTNFSCTLKNCTLGNTVLALGDFRLDIMGTNAGTGSVAGTVDFSAVPEPGTWALMLFGFGGMGVSMRRGRKQRLTQLA